MVSYRTSKSSVRSNSSTRNSATKRSRSTGNNRNGVKKFELTFDEKYGYSCLDAFYPCVFCSLVLDGYKDIMAHVRTHELNGDSPLEKGELSGCDDGSDDDDYESVESELEEALLATPPSSPVIEKSLTKTEEDSLTTPMPSNKPSELISNSVDSWRCEACGLTFSTSFQLLTHSVQHLVHECRQDGGAECEGECEILFAEFNKATARFYSHKLNEKHSGSLIQECLSKRETDDLVSSAITEQDTAYDSDCVILDGN